MNEFLKQYCIHWQSNTKFILTILNSYNTKYIFFNPSAPSPPLDFYFSVNPPPPADTKSVVKRSETSVVKIRKQMATVAPSRHDLHPSPFVVRQNCIII